jgi:hypothetical protein
VQFQARARHPGGTPGARGGAVSRPAWPLPPPSPPPCRVKFGAFYEHLDSLGAGGRFDRVASGHYARLERPVGGPPARLALTPDAIKDQTYFLAHLRPSQLERALFPLGCLTKAQVRELAKAAALPASGRRDSQGICFLGKVKFSEFVREHLGEWPCAQAAGGPPPPPRAGQGTAQRGGVPGSAGMGLQRPETCSPAARPQASGQGRLWRRRATRLWATTRGSGFTRSVSARASTCPEVPGAERYASARKSRGLRPPPPGGRWVALRSRRPPCVCVPPL